MGSGLEVLVEQGGPLGGALFGRVDGTSAILNRLVGLVWRKDERGSLGDNFTETSRTLPTAGEGTDTVDTADVCQGSQAVGDGGSVIAKSIFQP